MIRQFASSEILISLSFVQLELAWKNIDRLSSLKIWHSVCLMACNLNLGCKGALNQSTVILIFVMSYFSLQFFGAVFASKGYPFKNISEQPSE